MSQNAGTEALLGTYLKDRRAKLDPGAFGFTSKRRRTPGLRREEVAQRANISATWYTWLEQGRGGAPSAVVLDRISQALMLTDVEREHLFLLGLGRPPVGAVQTAFVGEKLHHLLQADAFGAGRHQRGQLAFKSLGVGEIVVVPLADDVAPGAGAAEVT